MEPKVDTNLYGTVSVDANGCHAQRGHVHTGHLDGGHEHAECIGKRPIGEHESGTGEGYVEQRSDYVGQ